MNADTRYSKRELYEMRVALVAHAMKMMVDHPGDQTISQYAKKIMQEDPAQILDRIRGVVVPEVEMVDF